MQGCLEVAWHCVTFIRHCGNEDTGSHIHCVSSSFPSLTPAFAVKIPALCLNSFATVCSSLFSTGLVRKPRLTYCKVLIFSGLCLSGFALSYSLISQSISALRVLLPLPLLLLLLLFQGLLFSQINSLTETMLIFLFC